MNKSSEHGAVAVEFALLLPILLLILLGIFEFGRSYNAQITLSHAAREGARVMAISNNPSETRAAIIYAAASLRPELNNSQISISSTDPHDSAAITIADACQANHQVSIAISYELDSVSGFFDAVQLQGKAVMRCGG